MKPVIYDPKAWAELDLALAASIVPDEFRAALDTILGAVVANPGYGFPTGVGPCRQAVLRWFPYSVIYADEEDRIFVLALAHHRRRPGYWTKRLRPN